MKRYVGSKEINLLEQPTTQAYMPLNTVLDPSNSQHIPPGSCALGIMTKAPEPGKVKTRLVPPLTHEEAAELNASFLRDVSAAIVTACSSDDLRPAQTIGARGLGIYTPHGAELAYDDILPPEFLLIPQRGADFGERLIFAAEDLFEIGFASVCLINSDSPTVPASSFAEAITELGKPGDRVVLGPSDDGGYYLIGLKQLHRRVFEEINWSTELVFEQTKQRVAELGLEMHELPIGFDIDDSAGLSRLCGEIFNAGSRKNVAPNTRKFLSNIIDREGRARLWPM